MKLRVCPLLVCFLAVIGCSEKRDSYSPSAAPLTGDPGQENCGFDLGAEVPNGPIIDPCGPEAQFLHGPVTLNPDAGTPALDNVALSIPKDGFICVTLNVEKIASATVTLNGETLFEPEDFNARVSELSRVVAVEQGEALMDFEILATPHGIFTYEIRYIPLDPVPRGEVSGDNNRLSIYNLRDHPDPFSPEKQDGIRDTVTLHVTASVVRDGISPRSANEYVVYGTFEIASPVTCQEIARLTTQITLAEVTPTSTDRNYVVPLTVVWDGRDNSGAFVDEGTYFYRAVAELVKITPPGSSRLLDIAYSEILTVTNDDIPPEITISPEDETTIDTDMPLITIGYSDEGSGVDTSTLVVLLNGDDAAARFDVADTQAIAQVDIDWYLDEGTNSIEVSVSDNAGNVGSEISEFTVHTPTEVLLEGLENPDPRYQHRSAHKLVCRFGEISIDILHDCLTRLMHKPEPRAVDCLLEICQSQEVDHFSRSLAVVGVGATAKADPDTKARTDTVDVLGTLLLEDPSFVIKTKAGIALGKTNDQALTYLDQYLTDGGPVSPPIPIDELYEEKLQYRTLNDAVSLQVVRSVIKLAGFGYQVGNPGDVESARKKHLGKIIDYFSRDSGSGGAP